MRALVHDAVLAEQVPLRGELLRRRLLPDRHLDPLLLPADAEGERDCPAGALPRPADHGLA